ncbi:SDR family oxidoreductase [Pseudarthrobacter sp. NPDC080039]|uniref:SDR family oxidoreductase n=1 Tax=unclassified Pseudarthrobacter TaxID=2647000 RepID=UPI00344FB7C5
MTVDETRVADDLFGVAGKVVLVTGGSRGIGEAIAEGFVKAGARVYICGRKADACEATAKRLSDYGECYPVPADLSSVEACRELAEKLARRETRVDVVVNNAGTLWAAGIDEYPESGWDKAFDLNVKGPFFLAQALLPLLRKSGTREDPARIINIGSIDAFHIPRHETYAYTSSKAAVHQLSLHLAHRLAAERITVNVIAPGMFFSKMMEATVEKEGADTVLGSVPLRRFVEASDMAGTAIYLASRAAAFVTGVVIPVDGGYATTL